MPRIPAFVRARAASLARVAAVLAGLLALTAPGATALAQPAGDALRPGLFAEHRDAFMERMEGGLAVFPTTPEIPRNDTRYPWRQDSDLWWLTGFDEPGAVAVLRPDASAGERYALFVRPGNPEATWSPRRAGVEGARETHAVEVAFPIDSLEPLLARWLDGVDRVWYDASEDHPWAHATIDSILDRWEAAVPDRRELLDADRITSELRLVKDPEEIDLLRKAADITVDAQRVAMAAIRPGMGEWEVEALIEFVYRAHGAARVGFHSIVASGPKSVIVHYKSNDRRMEAGDLVVMDIGAEWHHYTADVTRTVPVSGTFTPEQRTIYSIVLEAQKAAIESIRPGVTIAEVEQRGNEVVTAGLIRAGLLEGTVEENLSSAAFRTYLMHYISHWLGLDVHDVGDRVSDGQPRVLEPGMVLTVEPGVYIAEGMEGVDPKWWNIGVRIEDDVVVTADGHENLSDGAPREIEAIEALMEGHGLPELVPDIFSTR